MKCLIAYNRMNIDLNPIENIWGDIIKDFNAREAVNKNQVFESARQIWLSCENRENYWANLSDSMVTRLDDCLEANGYWTKY